MLIDGVYQTPINIILKEEVYMVKKDLRTCALILVAAMAVCITCNRGGLQKTILQKALMTWDPKKIVAGDTVSSGNDYLLVKIINEITGETIPLQEENYKKNVGGTTATRNMTI